jgi:oligopeptide transport system permease protein
LADKVRVSFELGAYAFLLALLLGIPWGCQAARYPEKFFSRSAMAVATVLICIPSFALGPILDHIFALRLHWFRVMGWCGWRCKVLPSVTLGIIQAAFLARLTRRSLAGEFARPYVRTARAKGLSESAVFWKHILRNGIGPTIAYLGPTCAALLSGTFAVESIFHIPGLGRLFIESIGNRDYGLVTGIVLLYALLIIVCNFFADVLLAAIGPRGGSG